MSKTSKTKVERDEVNDDVDALFKVPLRRFTGAGNALAARLKKSGLGDGKAKPGSGLRFCDYKALAQRSFNNTTVASYRESQIARLTPSLRLPASRGSAL